MSDSLRKPRYILQPTTTPAAGPDRKPNPKQDDPFIRPPAEDDDGYDPFSDRPPAPEPAFQEDPWR